MRLLKTGLLALGLAAVFAPGAAWAAMPPDAAVLVEAGFFKVNNSMVISWGVALLLIVAARLATRRTRLVPSGLQNFFEWLVETLYEFLAGIVGRELVGKTFWFFATVFIFVLSTNWFSLIPGVGSIGWGVPDAGGDLQYVSRPLMRGGNADLNLTSAMAAAFFACWIYWALSTHGAAGFLKHLFVYSGDAGGVTRFILVVVFLAVGVVEVVSILFRPVSLSFRLFGNIFAGESLLKAMATMGGPWFGWVTALPFYFFELLVGLVQALVFMLLTAIFTQLICSHGDEHHAGHGEKGHH